MARVPYKGVTVTGMTGYDLSQLKNFAIDTSDGEEIEVKHQGNLPRGEKEILYTDVKIDLEWYIQAGDAIPVKGETFATMVCTIPLAFTASGSFRVESCSTDAQADDGGKPGIVKASLTSTDDITIAPVA